MLLNEAGVGGSGMALILIVDDSPTEVHVMHLGDEPVEFVRAVGREVVPRIREL